MKPIKTVRYGEPFLLMIEIKNQASYTLKFKNTYLNLIKGAKLINSKYSEEAESFLKGGISKF